MDDRTTSLENGDALRKSDLHLLRAVLHVPVQLPARRRLSDSVTGSLQGILIAGVNGRGRRLKTSRASRDQRRVCAHHQRDAAVAGNTCSSRYPLARRPNPRALLEKRFRKFGDFPMRLAACGLDDLAELIEAHVSQAEPSADPAGTATSSLCGPAGSPARTSPAPLGLLRRRPLRFLAMRRTHVSCEMRCHRERAVTL